MHTIYSDILGRADRGMADLLIQIADYFYCKGAGMVSDPPSTPEMANLIAHLDARYQTEIMAARGWFDPPPSTADELPGWLLKLPHQNTQPLEGWGTEGWPI